MECLSLESAPPRIWTKTWIWYCIQNNEPGNPSVNCHFCSGFLCSLFCWVCYTAVWVFNLHFCIGNALLSKYHDLLPHRNYPGMHVCYSPLLSNRPCTRTDGQRIYHDSNNYSDCQGEKRQRLIWECSLCNPKCHWKTPDILTSCL